MLELAAVCGGRRRVALEPEESGPVFAVIMC